MNAINETSLTESITSTTLCLSCGKEIQEEDTTFCPECGSSVIFESDDRQNSQFLSSSSRSEEELIAEIRDSLDIAMLYLHQIKDMTTLFQDSVISTTSSANDTVSSYIASTKKMNDSLVKLMSSQSESNDVQFKHWMLVTKRIEKVLFDNTQEFISAIQKASKEALSVRVDRLQTAKDRLHIYMTEYQSTKVSFEQSASRLNVAIDNLETKRREIASQLKKIEGGDDIKKLMAAMAETIHGKRSVERERLKLEEDLHKKASTQVRQNVGRYVDEAKENRRLRK